MIILGIDPGTVRVGWAVLKTKKQGELVPLNYGCWEIKEMSQGQRLNKIATLFTQTLKQHQPQVLVLEKVFFFQNTKTALSISQAIGVLIYLSQKHKVPYLELTPLEIKQYLVGYGRADKKEVQKLIQCYFSFAELPKPDDTADALAVALAGFNKIKNNKLSF